MDKVRVRYAPSPTGHLHIGGAKNSIILTIYLLNIMVEIFIFRLEDTDIEEILKVAEASQLEIWNG